MKAYLPVAWVCVDCYVLHVNGEIDPGLDSDTAARLLSLLGGCEFTAGLLREDHSQWCGSELSDGECNCETDDFSWSHCDGCGSTLGGTRHALTAWHNE